MPRIRKHESIGSKKEKIWLVGPYIRLSRDDGNDESLSVTNQKKIIIDFFEREFHEPYIIVDWYIDDGVSGTTGDERPDFQRAITDMKSGKINCISCKTLSRAFRNYADQGRYLEQIFPTYNLRFISIGSPKVDTHLDPNAVIDGMELPINGLMNDRYAARTSQDIRRVFDVKRRNGEFIGAFAPYGYKKNPENKNHLIIDDEAAAVVRDIFRWYTVDGMSKLGIVKHLNELGVMTPTAYKHSKGFNLKTPNRERNDGYWAIVTVAAILKNPMYIGTMVQGKQRVISYKVKKAIQTPEDEWYVVENTHEPIIDKDTFNKSLSLLKQDTRTGEGKTLYLFSGFLRCSCCNGGMRRRANKKKLASGEIREYVYYTCSTHAFKGKHLCTAHSIKNEELESAVLQAIQAQISLVTNMADVVAQINQQTNVSVSNSSKRLKSQLVEKKRELEKFVTAVDSLYLDWKSGDITKSDYARMKENFEEKAENIRRIIANIEIEIELVSQGIDDDNPYLTTFMQHQNIDELNRSLLIELVDTIYVHEGKELTVNFNFTDQYQRIIDFIEENQEILVQFKVG